MKNTSLQEMFDNARRTTEFWAEDVKLEFLEEVAREMKHQQISRADLAKRIGTSPAYVTKLLRGHANLTVQSMAKIALAFDSKVRIFFEPIDSKINEEKVFYCNEIQALVESRRGPIPWRFSCGGVVENASVKRKPHLQGDDMSNGEPSLCQITS